MGLNLFFCSPGCYASGFKYGSSSIATTLTTQAVTLKEQVPALYGTVTTNRHFIFLFWPTVTMPYFSSFYEDARVLTRSWLPSMTGCACVWLPWCVSMGVCVWEWVWLPRCVSMIGCAYGCVWMYNCPDSLVWVCVYGCVCVCVWMCNCP